MFKPSLIRSRKAVAIIAGLTLLAGGAGVVVAQSAQEPIIWDKRRLDQLDRNVRRLERALYQRNAAGQPLLVEPDPEVIALRGQVNGMERRLSDLEATLQRVNADLARSTRPPAPPTGCVNACSIPKDASPSWKARFPLWRRPGRPSRCRKAGRPLRTSPQPCAT